MKTLPPFPTGSVPDKSQVYPPSEDTFLLLNIAKEVIKPDDCVLEVGTGSGYVFHRIPPCRLVVATDINPHAILLAKKPGLHIIRTDLTAGLRKVFSLVLFNPPYLPTLPEERGDDWLEFALDGGPDGRRTVIRFFKQVTDILSDNGRILILISSLQKFNQCEELFSSSGFDYVVSGSEFMDDGEELRVYNLIRKEEE